LFSLLLSSPIVRSPGTNYKRPHLLHLLRRRPAAAMAANASSSAFASVIASAKPLAVNLPPTVDYVVQAVTSASPLTVLVTIIAMCVLYDQGMLGSPFLGRPSAC
jgi:hypothetical protein